MYADISIEVNEKKELLWTVVAEIHRISLFVVNNYFVRVGVGGVQWKTIFILEPKQFVCFLRAAVTDIQTSR